MKHTELVRAARDAAKALQRAAVWKGSAKPVDATKDDYLYELLCYFQVALDAKKGFNIAHVGPAELGGAARWPRKPGKKKNFSYLALTGKPDANAKAQLCPGICVRDRHGKLRAPDVNLLRAECGDAPAHQDLLGCWDAKYLSNAEDRLPDHQISDFIYTFEELGSPQSPVMWSGVVGKPFSRSGVITNGKASTERDAALAKRGILETSGFPGKAITRP